MTSSDHRTDTHVGPPIGFRHTEQATFTADDIRAFARLVGDANPLHHDAAVAAASRFGGLIASGSHTVSVMMGAAASYFSRHWDNVGLGYSVRLKRPVMAGETATIDWRVVSREHSAKLGGLVLTLDGTLAKPDGQIAITATCQVLIPDRGLSAKPATEAP